jgi:hypothetical protein
LNPSRTRFIVGAIEHFKGNVRCHPVRSKSGVILSNRKWDVILSEVPRQRDEVEGSAAAFLTDSWKHAPGKKQFHSGDDAAEKCFAMILAQNQIPGDPPEISDIASFDKLGLGVFLVGAKLTTSGAFLFGSAVPTQPACPFCTRQGN